MLINAYKEKSKWMELKYFILLFFVVILSACSEKEAAKKATPAPAVSVYEITAKKIGSYREFVARTEAYKVADLRARVEGVLVERHFKEGSIVKKDQVLLQIAPAEYQAALAAAQADLSSRISGEDNAMRNLKRANELIEDGYISQADFDRLTTEDSQAKSAVKAAKSSVKKAQLNLDYTTITAPFTGRIGKVNYNVGNVVGPTSNVLASLTVTDPIYVNFQVEESLYITYMQKHRETKKAKDVAIDLSIQLPNNSLYSEKGLLDFADTKINQNTGTVELRALFPNNKGIIIPGLFVTLILESKDKQLMSLVPQSSVQENQQGKFVLVVNDDNVVSQRHVKLGRRINAMWVVETGLKEGEQVIVEGLQKVRQGIKVKAVAKSVDHITGTISDLTVN